MSWRWDVIIKAWPVLVALLVGALVLYTHSLRDDLEKSNRELGSLVEKLDTKDAALVAMKQASDADRQASAAQLEKERKLRGKADAENKALREALDASGCSNKPLPGAALNILRGQAKAAEHADDLRPAASGAAATVR
ncbi:MULTISPECIES: DUF2570 domain-containing protein [Serratia]|uniref:DUF2570 domain-containing protein n=1 Tax=Serratia TaxID=613 RepID=UPI000D3E910F|nr:DUF2570 domain-containing protein [Serratia marcescens]AWC81183.1 hypothetical protein AM377_16520 [Serratia marcescens]